MIETFKDLIKSFIEFNLPTSEVANVTTVSIVKYFEGLYKSKKNHYFISSD